MSFRIKMGSVGADERRPGVWLVGKVQAREVNGRQTDTVRHPHWVGSEADALRVLMRELLTHEPDLFHLFVLYAMTLASAYMYAPGPTIRNERLKKGWSQARLSRESGVSVRQLRRIETHHEVEPKALTVARILAALRRET